jgi:alpha-galactosidase
MLPLGRLALGARDTKFTPDEQQTLMTLWSIARSPLIMGGDLRHLDAATLALLTNPEVMAVNQRSRANRPQRADEGTRIWSAMDAGKAQPSTTWRCSIPRMPPARSASTCRA